MNKTERYNIIANEVQCVKGLVSAMSEEIIANYADSDLKIVLTSLQNIITDAIIDKLNRIQEQAEEMLK